MNLTISLSLQLIKTWKIKWIHDLNENVFNLSPTQERRLMGCGCYSSKKLGGCQWELGRLCWQLVGPLWQMGRFKRPQGRFLKQLEVPQRQLRGCLRGEEYSLFEAKTGQLKN